MSKLRIWAVVWKGRQYEARRTVGLWCEEVCLATPSLVLETTERNAGLEYRVYIAEVWLTDYPACVSSLIFSVIPVDGES